MLPLDTVWLIERDGRSQPVLIREKAMEVGLEALRAAGVEGVMVRSRVGSAEAALRALRCEPRRRTGVCVQRARRVRLP